MIERGWTVGPSVKFTRARGAHVLIVDDDVIVRALAAALLEQMGARCEGVATGPEASTAASGAASRGHPFDIVLLDQNLWQETGLEVCQRLRGEGVEAPIIAMSGDGFTVDSAFRNAGFDGWLKKPFSAQELHACVEGHLAGKYGSSVETA
jgi:two-component system, OmpR family, phosphate regulon response regulator OmpR